ncbi:MAG TPA: hypothetical protein VMT66_02125 [Steroidobacteraceae bacterium]|nr:hypothetical protein [Steroidobacteraceae bacterium]
MGKLRYGRITWIACAGLLLLEGCGRDNPDEMGWARAALERNKSLEIVAADPQSHTFTVRLKNGGALRTVRADQVIASPAEATLESASVPESRPGATSAVGQGDSRTDTGEQLAQTEPASAGEAATPTEAPTPHPEPVLTSESSAGLANVRPGRVLEAGPGYTITAAQPGGPSAQRLRDSAVAAPLEHRHEPIVCQGSRLLHIDNRNLMFDGDAVSALDGCEIYITNSHISASGVGVAARSANVHIDNSQIEGEQASIEASGGAHVYIATSHFKGLSRRLDTATVHDLGGNVWN